MATKRPIIEVAVADLDDAIAAETAGADRLELNAAMPLGGLTPSAGLVRDVLEAVSIPVVVMVRPRPGGFCYSMAQWSTAMHEAEWILSVGAAGVVCGVLDAMRNIDVERTAAMRSLVADREFVFHRAFDLTPQWSAALETLTDLGVDRILSSGQQSDVMAGIDCLAAMQQQAGSRLEVIAGSGVRPETLVPLWKIGLRQFHGTFSRPLADPGYESGNFRFAVNDHLRGLDVAALRAARELVNRLGAV
jgi:copper homeostasis protein